MCQRFALNSVSVLPHLPFAGVRSVGLPRPPPARRRGLDA